MYKMVMYYPWIDDMEFFFENTLDKCRDKGWNPTLGYNWMYVSEDYMPQCNYQIKSMSV